MLLQVISRKNEHADRKLSDVPKDPRNQQAVNILFLAVLPLGLQLVAGKSLLFISLMIAVMALFGGALWRFSEGIKNGDTYNAAPAARAPKIPMRLAGAAVMMLAVTILGTARSGDLGQGLLYGAICGGLSVLAFGIDPLRNKGLENSHDRAKFKAEKAAGDTQPRLQKMSGQIAILNDADLSELIEGFGASVTRMLDVACDNPTRQRVLQSHLGVYLDGVERATDQFATLYRATSDQSARADYMQFLCDMAEEFEARATRYAQDSKIDLDVEIAVLRQQIGAKG